MKIDKNKAKEIYFGIVKNSIWLAIILLLVDTYAFFFMESQYLKDLFNFASEKTPATWLSSTLFLLIGFSLFGLQIIKKQNKWHYFGYFFLYLSLDDASYMHEQVSSWISSKYDFIKNLPGYGWLYTIAPILLLILIKVIMI